MGEIKIDLTQIKFDDLDEALFLDDELILKNKNFIFAKNGSGKSTLADAIKKQKENEYDVHIFKGFESVLGENEKLNAFALATDGGENQKRIEELEHDKTAKEISKTQISDSLKEPIEENADNFFTKKKKAEKRLLEKQGVIDEFLYESGKFISSHQIPTLTENPRSYNKNSFKNEISKRQQLQEVEISRAKELLKSEPRLLNTYDFSNINYKKYLISINEILQSKVEEKTKIVRLNSQERINFAQRGLELHKHDEENICAFCGNEITIETIEELETYFSADEVKALKHRIIKGKDQISKEIERIDNLKLNSKDFYPDFIPEVEDEIQNINEQTKIVKTFLIELINSLEIKEKNLFSESSVLEISVPANIDLFNFNNLIKKNNEFSKNLTAEQEKARAKLRYHEIYNLVEKKHYAVMLNEQENAQENLDEAQKNFQFELTKKIALENEINNLDVEIAALQPKAEKQAINHINKKLSSKVLWELDFFDDENSGYYQIKQDGKCRGVKQLSTGEKNVIAFLYFIEKLEEMKETPKKNKIVVFDDPMSSNDDTMQYLIICELQRIFQGNEKNKFIPDKDFLIILTHNVHFYLNVQPHGNFKDKKLDKTDKNNPKLKEVSKYDKNNFYRIQNRSFKLITGEHEDFKTSYEGLWIELKDLYACGHKNSMLNSMRRIIETYTKFNSIDTKKFYKGNDEYLKLFNVNSHSIDDLSAESFTEDKEQMKDLFRQIFVDNDAESHFEKYWEK
ncbi:AAA family ATPase [Lactococcus lactis]|uniref:AAA family ATPase n=1 Tax=Lactococcus lactis TaxID=1358 RepID=UPI00101E875B|nr:AAA family ATPase [Lactococcus lactis]QBC37560.1 hypothetical protein EQZ99_06000 [Lactococcus lactis]